MPTSSKDKRKQNWRRFAASFIEVVHLKPGEKCSLKSHFKSGSVMREVVGYYDWMAKNPERFVFAKTITIRKATKQWKKGTSENEQDKQKRPPFSQQWIDAAIECARELGIITVRTQGKNPKGAPVWGVKVLRHDDLACQRDDGLCFWIDGDPFEPRHISTESGKQEVLHRRITKVTFHGPDHDCPDCERARKRMADPVVQAAIKARRT